MAHYLATRPEVAFHQSASRWIELSELDAKQIAGGAIFC
jgi:hypothetical protein